MAHCYEFAIAQFRTEAPRNEQLNVAIIALKDESVEVFGLKSLDKLRAISAAVDLDDVRRAIERIPELDDFATSQGIYLFSDRLRLIEELSPLRFSPTSELAAASVSSFDNQMQLLLARLVQPEPAPARPVRLRTTGLLTDVKTAFKNEGVLAAKGEDISNHRVVANYVIAEGLQADLLLKNGAMHVIQTVDASDEGFARRAINSIAISALVFEQARMSFGQDFTKSELVYKATSTLERLITPSLSAAEHQGARLVNWESRDDRTRFVISKASLATPIERKKDRGRFVHASNQGRFKLN
jgi:hypothetical protein